MLPARPDAARPRAVATTGGGGLAIARASGAAPCWTSRLVTGANRDHIVIAHFAHSRRRPGVQGLRATRGRHELDLHDRVHTLYDCSEVAPLQAIRGLVLVEDDVEIAQRHRRSPGYAVESWRRLASPNESAVREGLV